MAKKLKKKFKDCKIVEITFNWFSGINACTGLPNVSYKQF